MLWRECVTGDEELLCSVPMILIVWTCHQSEGDFNFNDYVYNRFPLCKPIHFIWGATVMSFNAEGECSRPRESSKVLSWYLLKKVLGIFWIITFFSCSLTLEPNPCVRCKAAVYNDYK